MITTQKYSLTLSLENRKKLDKLAKEKDRKVNWLINKAIEEYLKREP